MRATKRNPWARTGVVVLALAGLVFTVAHAGCGNSEPASGLAGYTPTGGTPSISLTLINNCGEGLNARMNKDTPWRSNGVVKCAVGAICPVVPGTYPVDIGMQGLLLFVGSGSGNATKAEITYQTELVFDISLITESGQCPDSCTQSSCCVQAFNHPIKISTTPVSRCVQCDSVACPDGFHYPTDNSKQVNATAATALTVEFCPAAACPATGWRECGAAEMGICREIGNQPCVGELTVCCPKPTGAMNHACFCETGTFCGHAPNIYNPCGMDRAQYCYVPN